MTFKELLFGKKVPVQEQVMDMLRRVYDPEIPVNIVELGLIYEVNVDQENNILIKMTLTSPGCPVAVSMPALIKKHVEAIEVVNSVDVELVWDPPWSEASMSEQAKLELGIL